MYTWLKTALVGRWLGRIITVALASVGGLLTSLGVEKAIVEGWVAATEQLIIGLLPILIALGLDWVQHWRDLKTMPPVK